MTRVSADLLSKLHVLLDQALDLAPEDRQVWLESVRLTDPAHAAELERLLALEAGLDARRFLTPRTGGPPARSGASLAGMRLGAWTLERPLGHGGMGTVWLARRSDGRFEGEAAIKLLNLALLDPVGAERFRREGTLLARVGHPHIARLLDAGVTDGGEPYLVLERVEGERIDQYCDARLLPPAKRIALMLDVLDAVGHAHANLIVHRDLKPSNILVTPDGSVKLLDFGIAKLVDQGAEAHDLTLTETGARALTPEYAAPEQISGGPVTTGTDVYALGVLLYLLLAGKHPTGSGSRSTAEHLKGILDTEPARMSTAVTHAELRATSPERLRRLYAGDLDNIVGKALKKRPEERYATVGAMAEDLRRYLDHLPVKARPDSWRYRAAKFVRRNRGSVGLTALALLALLGGLAGTMTQAARATAQASRADSAALDARGERDFAYRQLSRVEAVNDLNFFVLSDAAPDGRPFTLSTLMAQAESIVDRDRISSDADRVDLLVALGRQYSLHEEGAKARQLLEQAYALSRDARDRSVSAKAACALAAQVARAGELDRSDTLVRSGLAELPAADPRYALDRIYCLLHGSEVARARDETALAVERVEEAERLHRDLRFPAPSLGLHIQLTLATVYHWASRLQDASRAFARAQQTFADLGRDRTESAGTLYNNWGLMLLIAGRPIAAESLFHRAMAIGRSDSEMENVAPMLLANYARALNELERFDEAARYAEEAYVRARRSGDEFVVSIALRLRAMIYSGQGRRDRADAMLAELMPRLRSYPPRHAATMHLQHTVAQLALARGDGAAAWAGADSAVDLARTLPGASQFLPIMLLRRAEVALAIGRMDEALRDASEARTAVAALVGDDPSAHAGAAELIIAQVLRAEGRGDESRSAAKAAVEQLRATVGPAHSKTRLASRLAG